MSDLSALDLTTIAERDAELRYAVSNDQDDTGRRERIYIMCGCCWDRRMGELEPCPEHSEEL